MTDDRRQAIRWHWGTPAVREGVEASWQGRSPAGEVLHDNPRRRLLRLRGAHGDWILKQFRLGSGRHPARDGWKVRLGASPGRREARMLVRLHAAGVPVPEPLAFGVAPGGDELLVLRFLEGQELRPALAGTAPARRSLLASLGGALDRLHAAGFVHRDLHPGNVLVTADGPFLLDLQKARRRRGPRARLRDLGDLDFSLWECLSLPDRIRLRAAALGLARPFPETARVALRRVGDAALRRAWLHGRSRTRRALLPGRLYARLRLEGARGMRWRELPEGAVAEALAAHREALARGDQRVWKADGRSRISAVEAAGRPVLVKEVLPRGRARLLADAVRGSAARRAWRAGHGLLARGIGAPRPLAFLERRRAGLPLASWLVLERLDPTRDAVALGPEDPEGILDALLRLVERLHRRAVDHGDLKATHVLLGLEAPQMEARLVDLEGVRFRRHLSDTRRLAALAELNASLPDAVPSAARLERFQRYAAGQPFSVPPRRALRELVRRSLARRHRWTGADCDCARTDGSPASDGRSAPAGEGSGDGRGVRRAAGKARDPKA